MCFEVASAALILSLFPASCELKWGLSSSSTGVGRFLFDSSSACCWLSRTGSLPTLLPPTTGILLSPDALACVLFSLGGSWRLVRDSLCGSSVLHGAVFTPSPFVPFGLANWLSTVASPLPLDLAEAGASLG